MVAASAINAYRRFRASPLAWPAAVVAILFLTLALRGAGLYRGLPQDVSYHPDAAKQVQALGQYLEGRYIWYTGSRFYDGYPLFLNHFDEWVLRVVRPAVCAVSAFFGRSCDPAPPDSPALFYWTLTLRWLYGGWVVLLTGWIARRLRFPRRAAATAMLLVALSPVSITVSRFATGDIACDLFFSLSVLFLTGHALRGRWPALFASGVMASWAFAGKYNGGMTVLVPAGYILLLSLRGERRLARFAGMGAIAAGGFFAGVLSAIPQFVWATKQTWRDTLRVIRHVKDYRTPEDHLSLPVWEQAWQSFSSNAGDVFWALGVLGLIAAIMGLLLAAFEWNRRRSDADPEAFRRLSLLVSLFAFPWLVLLLSLKSKLHLHPFYFSWIVPALALAALYALARVLPRGRAAPPANRLVFAFGALVLIAEIAWRVPREMYFWRREDIQTVALLQQRQAVLPETGRQRRRAQDRDAGAFAIRDFLIEPRNDANFRNRFTQSRSPDAPAWRSFAVMPLPVIPYGTPVTDWVVFNGPTLPRSDRMIPLPPGQTLDVTVVTHEPLTEARLGLQTGRYPARLCGSWGRRRFSARLDANDARVIHLTNLRPRLVLHDRGRTESPIYHYRLRLYASPGPAWITLIASPLEEQAFRLYSGDPAIEADALFNAVDVETLAERVEDIRYRSGDPQGALIAAGDRHPIHLWDASEVLPAGAYRLRLSAAGLEPDTRIRVYLTDPAGRAEPLEVRETFPLEPGRQDLVFEFEKPFAPFQCTIAVKALSGAARLEEWSLLPDVPAMAAAARSDQRPAWQRRFADRPLPEYRHAIHTTFGRRILLHDVAWPDPVTPGPRTFHARLSLLRPIRHFDEYDVFFHLCDADGRLLHAAHLRVDQTAQAEDDPMSLRVDIPDGIPAQTGIVRIGVWNRRTRQRLPVTDHPDHLPVHRRTLIEAGPVHYP